jgi:hypothetical protein
MKISKIDSIIREVLNELQDGPIVYGKDSKSKTDAIDKVKRTQGFTQLKQPDKDALIKGINKDIDGGVLEEDEVDEAKKGGGKKYKLTTDYAEKIARLPYKDSRKKMVWVNGIIDYIDQNGPKDITTIASEKFNVPQPRIADYARDMIMLGILEPEKEGDIPFFMRPKAEKPEDQPEENPEDYNDSVKDIDIATSLASFPTAEKEKEPEISNIAPSQLSKTSVAKQAAVDFFMDDRNDRLLQKLINMQSAARTKIKEIREAEGIGAGDFRKGEIGRKEQALSEIDQVIQTMVDRINAAGDEEVVNEILRLLAFKLNSVGYNKLYSKIERKVKEKSIDEIKRMQKLAGIDETKVTPSRVSILPEEYYEELNKLLEAYCEGCSDSDYDTPEIQSYDASENDDDFIVNKLLQRYSNKYTLLNRTLGWSINPDTDTPDKYYIKITIDKDRNEINVEVPTLHIDTQYYVGWFDKYGKYHTDYVNDDDNI